jgi:hypothetical protein
MVILTNFTVNIQKSKQNESKIENFKQIKLRNNIKTR